MNVKHAQAPKPEFDQTVAIFSSREDVITLVQTVEAAKRAIHCPSACIDIVINGNVELANLLPLHLGKVISSNCSGTKHIRVWFVAMGDKAHAWNQYVSHIWPKSDLAFFVDGMARVHENAFDAIGRGMAQRPQAWGGTGIPTQGISAKRLRKQMLDTGGIHGNLYAVRGGTLQELLRAGFTLPLGIYRTDPLLGAVLCFSLAPSVHEWDHNRIHVEETASWDFDNLRWWRYKDWKTHFRREQRQWQGVLENAAIKQWLAIDKKSPAELPRTAALLVSEWVQRHPDTAKQMLDGNPRCREALTKLLSSRDWSATLIAPTLIKQLKY